MLQQYLTTKRLEATELVRREGLSKLWYTRDYCVAKESVIIIRNTSTKQCPYLYVLTSLHLVESALYSLKSKWRPAGLSPLGTLGRNCFQDHSRCWQNSLLAVVGLRISSCWLFTGVHCQFLEASPRPFHMAPIISAMENLPCVVFFSHFKFGFLFCYQLAKTLSYGVTWLDKAYMHNLPILKLMSTKSPFAYNLTYSWNSKHGAH